MSADPIIWEGSIDDGAADAPRRMRVTKLLAQSGVESFIVEVHTQDAQKRDAWIETDDYVDTGAAAWATVEAQWKELEELRRRASAREVLPDLRERTSVELADALGVDVTTRWPVLLDKVRDLAVTDCAPASQAEQMLWQVRDALGEYPSRTRPTTWSGMLDEVRTLANPEGVPAKSELHEGAPSRPAVDCFPPINSYWLRRATNDGPHVVVHLNYSEDRVRVRGPHGLETHCTLAEFVTRYKPWGEADIPAGRMVVDAQGIASLRAELTALGKHVEDVERRAYDTPTKAEHVAALRAGAELAKKVASLDPLFSEARTAFDRVADVLDDGTAAAARVEFRKRLTDIEETTAGKAETLEAVRSLTDALQALEGRLADVEASVGQPGPLDALENRVERLEGHIEHRAWTAITQRVEALEMKVDDLAAGWGSCGPARPDEKREAVIREHEAGYREAPLDLATLRVSGQATGASETAVSFRPAGHALDIVVAVRVLPEYGGEERCEWATVDPHSARIIARALTQWADGAEKGAGK